MSALIKPEELLLLKGFKHLLIFDATGTPDARQKYSERHLDDAQFIDVNAQLADIKSNAADGGRHPLPSLDKFRVTLGELGITPDTQVVVYDDKNGSNAAARFWWMLKAIDHHDVRVLSGSIDAAVKAGFPVNTEPPANRKTTPYPINVNNWNLPVADITEVEVASTDDRYTIIDVRDAVRYDGIKEPIDLIAGHIPGAINIPFSENLDADGSFLSAADLKTKYDAALQNRSSDKIIVHCGSGITACHTLMAVAESGRDIPKLYVGSWSEWSRNEKEMITRKDL